MGVSQAIGFAALCGVVLLGVDYDQQSRRAGLKIGQMGIAHYAGTIRYRFDGAKEERRLAQLESDRKARWRAGGKVYLPEAPEGWSRHSVEELSHVFFPVDANAGSRNSQAGGVIAVNLMQQGGQKRARELDRSSWVYQAPDGLIRVDVQTQKGDAGNTLTGMASHVISTFDSMGKSFEGFGVFGGVGFVEVRSDMARMSDLNGFRKFQGRIGFDQAVDIRVLSDASDASIKTVLANLDYSGMNSLLQQPLTTVGNDISTPTAVQVSMAKAMQDLTNEFKTLRTRATQLRMEDIDALSLTANTFARGYTGTADILDLTAGRTTDMRGMLEQAYRQGLTDIANKYSEDDSSQAAVVPAAEGSAPVELAAVQPASTENPEPSGGGFARLLGRMLAEKHAQDTAETGEEAPEQVRVNKGLAQATTSNSTCVRRAGVLHCD